MNEKETIEKSKTMTGTETETVVVVGMNRTRMLKIMTMVEEADELNLDAVNFVPCVAIMSSYEGEDGEDIRYLSNFVFHDGSPMNRFFDDEEFQTSLSRVIMVGYEWVDSDRDLISKYFELFSLSVAIECVEPNPEFSSLRDEMQHYKNLTTEQKEEHSVNHTMGPKKMKKFIVDTLQPICITAQSETEIENTELEQEEEASKNSTQNDAEEEETKAPEDNKLQQRGPKDIDHNATTFACRMCRTVLLDESHLAEETIQNQHLYKKTPNHPTANGGSQCQSLFCDESVLAWLAPSGMEYDVKGKLICPNCSYKIGHWNWSGIQVPSGTWVVPAIQIPLGKIDVNLPPSERQNASPMVVVAPQVFG